MAPQRRGPRAVNAVASIRVMKYKYPLLRADTTTLGFFHITSPLCAMCDVSVIQNIYYS